MGVLIFGMSPCGFCDGTIDSYGEIVTFPHLSQLPEQLRDFNNTSFHRACLRRSLFEPLFRAVFVADVLGPIEPEQFIRLTKTRFYLARSGEDVVFGIFPEYFLFTCSAAEFLTLSDAFAVNPTPNRFLASVGRHFQVSPYRQGFLLKTFDQGSNQNIHDWIVFSRERWEAFRADWRHAAEKLLR